MSQADLPLLAYDGVALPHRRTRPLGVMFAAVYLTFAAILLLEPQPVLDWLDDLDPSPLVAAARASMVRVAAVSRGRAARLPGGIADVLRGRGAPAFPHP